MKRGYKQITGARTLKRTYRKKNRRMGLVPSYRGWQPRMFQKGEWKYSDVTLDGAMDTTGGQTLLNGLSLGNTASTRVGMKVSIRSIELRLVLFATPTTGVDQQHRIQIFLDKQANAAAPTLADQLTGNNFLALRSLTQRRRFKIMWDKTYNINASGEPNTAKVIKMYMKFRRPLVVEFNSADNGTIADIVSNSLYFYRVGSNVAGVNAGSLVGTARIRYTDI